MRKINTLAAGICAMVAMTAFIGTAPAKAQQEPHYLHALENLRTARDYFQFDSHRYKGERKAIVEEINKSIEEVKHAAWDDGKNTKFAGPGAAGNDWAPVHYGINALKGARHDVEMGIDTPANTGLRDRAIHHIDEAMRLAGGLLQAGAQ